MSTAASVVNRSASEQTLQWLALGLTPGLGPTRVRHLVEHFGSVAATFRASLTELEATGLMAVSAQALGTGKSLEVAQEELGKAPAAGMARGVDTAAHRGAVAAEGKTVAVFATGVDVLYPRRTPA